uniref:Uncharacterized protein n=1 Tax=Chromera velia CCMP2878 TaxID=1169474 RepID=A0A0G4I4Y0_9ALVE|eukprot:Cvel_11023.t1-p1 / transcript=Cvel_11023.t1 / gene=Cvel_11023 / organism=Chromera_velia_CCMP2878 / gene_product=hypothetical protein / transcript_product=hypothetical protein / location=Cvel_scaffold680:1-5717(+) / protein_length=212 / sequence_SO=supercontig / SO=protein_coding / is_pseudo=false
MYRPDAHTFELTSESYLEGIDVDAIPGKLKKSLSEKDVAPAEEQDVDMSLQGVYQEANGVLGWAVHLNWKRALWFSLLSKATTKPTARHLSAVKTAIHGLKTHREPFVLHGLKGRELHLAGCSDAMWNRPKYEGRQGDMMMLNDESWDLERDGLQNGDAGALEALWVLWVSLLPFAARELMAALDGSLGGASRLYVYICMKPDGVPAGVSLR